MHPRQNPGYAYGMLPNRIIFADRAKELVLKEPVLRSAQKAYRPRLARSVVKTADCSRALVMRGDPAMTAAAAAAVPAAVIEVTSILIQSRWQPPV